MSRALIIDDSTILELFGSKYIPFNDLNEKLKEYKVTKNEVINLEYEEELYTAYIYTSPKQINCYQEKLSISSKNSDIQIPTMQAGDKIEFDPSNNLIVNSSNLAIFKNYQLCTDKLVSYQVGDVIHIGTELCIIAKDKFKYEITVYNPKRIRVSVATLDGLTANNKDFPLYTNSPKLKYTIPETKVNLRGPKEDEKKSELKAIIKRLIPIMITFTLTIVLMYFKPRGPYVIISLTTTFVTVIITIINFIDEKKQNKIFNSKRGLIYENYLHQTIKELTSLKGEEERILKYLFPTPLSLIEEVNNDSTRLYERDEEDEDFLKLNIGTSSSQPTYDISNPIDNLKIEKDALELRVDAIYNKFKELDNVPKVVNLLEDNIGIVGPKSIVNNQIQNLMFQLAFFHSYHDIKLIPIIEPSEKNQFQKFVYTKHLQFEDGLYSLIDDELTRDGILSGVVQVLRARQNADEEVSKLPLFILVITNFDLIANHPIMEFINDESHDLGLKIIFASERQENLISNLQTIVQIKNSQQARIVIEHSVIKDDKFVLEPALIPEELESSIKKIGQLDHIKGVKSSLPEAVSFLEMYDVERVHDLDVSRRWRQNRTNKTIKALIGKKSQIDDVYLDLHEKAHGPHGLVAGTTGSGKSEVIQTYILSLAINYSPEYVGFLLIDYKGGGMANLFKNMPHLLGSITNLDGYLAMRAMESIKGELKRRQSLFSKYEVNHINGYHKLYEKGEVTEPLPHLFLISDEFAELKSNEPEFMKELVSAARIGRSLGIHLILATQKPSGVVDDQIWSNSKFKLCLKVAEPADSRELLKTTDAAYIVEPGRGYLKVGTNELYELFQSGYSGADYNKGEGSSKDDRVFVIDKYGRENLLNKKEKNTNVETQDELTVVLDEVSNVYADGNYVPVTKPWLPPLEDNVALTLEYKPLDDTKLNLNTTIGLIDIPSKQSQIPLTIDILEDGNIGIFGSMQTGKTTTVQSILIDLASKNSPRNLKYYILDFGSGKLVSLKGLKHTADYITIEDSDKLNKLIKNLKQEVKERKQKLSEALASNFAGYNQVADTPMQAIVLTLDNYDVLRDMGELGAEFNFIYREGSSLGIYIITTAVRIGSLRLPHQSAISKAIQHFTSDRTDVTNALGARSNYELKEIQGRVQVKLDDPQVAQIYLPVPAPSEKDYINNLKEAVTTINNNTSYQNEPLPIMPEVVEYKAEYKKQDKIFLGLDYEDVAPQYLSYDDILVYGSSGNGKSSIIKKLLSQVEREIYIIDDQDYTAHSKGIPGKVFDNDQIMTALELLESELRSLIENYEKEREKNSSYSFYDYKKVVTGKFVYINQTSFMNKLSLADKGRFSSTINGLSKVGYIIIYEVDNILEANDLNKLAKEVKQKIYVGEPSAQSLVRVPVGKQSTKEGELYNFSRGMKLVKFN